ncbi:hypothetical protein I4U23_003621 [Adineta vaga]|nr:hypothetical protein I4U23_003621 [Adineta vaga]
MISDNKSRTLFEHLPVEIILHILDFFSFQQLLTSFSNLNLCINAIIQSVRHKYHGVRNNNIDSIQLLQAFPTLIDSFVIINSDTVDLTPLINLRSLSLEYATYTQLNSIRPECFPLLEILHIKDVHESSKDNAKVIHNIFEVILSNGFPRLRICTALDVGTVPFSKTWTGSPNLRVLNLPIRTDEDKEKLRRKFPQICRLTTYEQSLIDPNPNILVNRRKRFEQDIQKLKELELENRFIFDNYSGHHSFDTNNPPPRFNNTRIDKRIIKEGFTIIQGRILLQTEPYRDGSFLVEIAFPQEYPFKHPNITFLDPIYHPNISKSGACCGCDCGFRFSTPVMYRPTTTLNSIIMKIIETIEQPFPIDAEESHNPKCLIEYRNDYQTFYKKAFECTLTYGRPRY